MRRWTERPMTEAQAIEYLSWTYDEEYAFYNTPESGFDESLHEIHENMENWFAVVNEAGDMEGIFEYEWQANGSVEIGLGLKPELTGQGLGIAFVRQCVSFCRRHYGKPDAVIELRVLDSNARAITVYRRAGFRDVRLEDADSFGKPVVFLRMRLEPVTYQEFGAERLDEVRSLYSEAGWRAYLNDDDRLKAAYGNSLCVLGAFDMGRLIGFVRCVGDGEHVVLIQDVVVRAAHRRRGIGTQLVKRVLDRFRHVRMISLYTDSEDEADNRFYQSLGLRRIEDAGMASYMK